MKRRISLVIAFALSFLMIFSSIARAEEIKVPISVQTSESTEIEIIIKVPLAKMNQVDSKLPQAKAEVWVGEEGKQISQPVECDPSLRCGECQNSSGANGIWKTGENGSAICKPCIQIMCGGCTPSTGACGHWQTGINGVRSCVACGACGKYLTITP